MREQDRRPAVVVCPRPWHGLGNRIRSVLGARVLARHTGRRFAYAWPTGRHFGARLDELWQVPDRVVPVWWSQLMTVRHPYRDESLRWLPAAQHEKVWQIRTAHALQLPVDAPPWGTELHALRPTREIADRIKAFHQTDLGAGPYVGVMVRTHAVAHAETLSSSPVEWYIERLRQIRAAWPGVTFFVSADTDAAQRALAAAVPGCVGLSGKGPYNSREALMSSIVDLYLLASSVHVVGAHYSSFPELAQQLGGDGLRLETPQAVLDGNLGSLSWTRPLDPLLPHQRTPVALEELR